MAILILKWKPRPEGGLKGEKAEDIAAGLQPPNGLTLLSRRTCYCDDDEVERSKMRSAIMKMAMAKPLAFGRAGGPSSHPTQVGVMAKFSFVFVFFLFKNPGFPQVRRRFGPVEARCVRPSVRPSVALLFCF